MLNPALCSVVRALERAGVGWCAFDVDAADRMQSDIALLVDDAWEREVDEILAAQHFMQVPSDRGRTWISFHRITGLWVCVLVHSQLAFGPYSSLRTGAERACLARRQPDGGDLDVYRLHPGDRFWVMLLEHLLAGRAFETGELECLQGLAGAARADDPPARAVDEACAAGTGWTAARILQAVRQGAWQDLLLAAPRLAAAWLRHPRLGSALRPLTGRLAALVDAVRLRARPGMTVALLGPDGCGKSTLAAQIRQTYRLPVSLIYMGLWQQNANDGQELRLPGWSLARRLLKVWRQYLVGQYYRMLGRLVIYDRYTYDALLASHLRRADGLLARLYASTLAHACPPPDLALVLDAPGVVMYARKQQGSDPERLEAERQGFLWLSEQVPGLQVVDATYPLESVRADVVDRIWRHYFESRS